MNFYEYQRPVGKIQDIIELRDKFIEVFRLEKEESEKIKFAVAIDRTPELIKKNYNIDKKNIKSNLDIKTAKPLELMEIPLYASVSAGLGCEKINEPLEYIAIPKMKGNIISVIVNGDSMEDTITDGAIVVVDTDVMPEIGEIGVFLTTGTEHPDGLVKRLRHKNGVYVLESDNKKYKDIEIEDTNIEAFGKVMKIITNTSKKNKDPLLEKLEKLDENQRILLEQLMDNLLK